MSAMSGGPISESRSWEFESGRSVANGREEANVSAMSGRRVSELRTICAWEAAES